MYNNLLDGLVTLEPIDGSDYHLMMLDPTVEGCNYLIEKKSYYLQESPLVGFCEEDTNGLLRVELKSAILVDKHYWIIDYVYNATEFEAWGLKKDYSESAMIGICKELLSASVHSMFDEHYQKKYGKDDGFGMMGIIFEEKIAPGLRLLECGELPNGIEASFLICDPEAIIKELFGSNISPSRKAKLMAEGHEMLAAIHHTHSEFQPVQYLQSRPASPKMKTKQEKRLKNWSQSKKGKTDS
jgi:hypothetical protein